MGRLQVQRELWRGGNGQVVSAEASDGTLILSIKKDGREQDQKIAMQFMPVSELEHLKAQLCGDQLVTWLPRVTYRMMLSEGTSWEGMVLTKQAKFVAPIQEGQLIVFSVEGEFCIWERQQRQTTWHLLPVPAGSYWTVGCSQDTGCVVLLWEVFVLHLFYLE